MKYVLAIFLFLIGCSFPRPEIQKFNNVASLSELEKRAIEEMPIEKQAYIMGYLKKYDSYPIHFINAIESYNRSSPCVYQEKQKGMSTATAVGLGVVGGVVGSKLLRNKKRK